MNNFALPRLIVWIVTALALPFAMVIGSWVGEGRTRELFMLVGLAILGILLFGIPQWLWLFAVGSMFVPGQLPFLPLPFKPLELFLILLIAKFIVEDVIFKKQWIKLGPSPDYVFLLGFLVVMMFHGIHDRFAMRLLGSDVWGGRSYVSLLIAFAAYFILQSTRPDLRPFRHLPSIILAFGFIDFAINAVTFAIPELGGPLSRVYSDVSMDIGVDFSRRLGFAGNFGYLLLFWSLSDCRIQDFLTKGRLFKAAVFGLGLILCGISGYRSTLFIAAVIVAVAAFRDFGFASVFLLIPVSLALSALVGLHLAGVQLPVIIQRGLVWIPGAGWDEAATADASGSNDFRDEVWDLWRRTEFVKHPVLGRGFALNFEDMIATLPFTSDESGGYTGEAVMLSKYSRNEAFVVSGNIHHGLYSTIDRFGLTGCLCLTAWTIVALRRMFKELISSRTRPMNPALQWLSLYVITFTIGFPLGALRVENFLPQQLFLCGLFATLLAATQKSADVPLGKRNFKAVRPPIRQFEVSQRQITATATSSSPR